jgi:DNA-directed RNA polymerase specialized sigma24 family protein
MSSTNSVTALIADAKKGDPAAAQQLWERYFPRLVRLARTKLPKAQRRMADEEDVALSAFGSFCRGVANERFPQLRDRNNLWPLLALITVRKAVDVINYNNAERRGGGKVRGESAFLDGSEEAANAGIDHAIDRKPTPEVVVEMEEEYQRLLDKLGEEPLQRIAVLEMEGHTNKEIAAKLGCSLTAVERKLRRIRELWQKEAAK